MRYKITLTPVPDDCTDADTVDAKDWRGASYRLVTIRVVSYVRVGEAMVEAIPVLPKPRPHPQPGDVLRRKSNGQTILTDNGPQPSQGIDPDEWEVLTKAEIDAMFDRKRENRG